MLLLYLLPNLGFSISAHYCGGELASWNLTGDAIDLCACDGKTMKKDCCENKKVTVRSSIDQQQVEPPVFDFTKAFQPGIPPVRYTEQRSIYAYAKKATASYFLFYPPPILRQPIYIMNSNFRI